MVPDELGLQREAANDNRGGELEIAPSHDPFGGDMEAWLEWLMDCVAIESSIRGRVRDQALEGARGGTEPGASVAPSSEDGGAAGASAGAAGPELEPGSPATGGAGAQGAVRDSTRPTGR